MTTILVADDDASIRQTLALFLEGKGYRVLVAEDGEGAVALARAEEPDLVLLDIRMPRLDGLAALRALKEDARCTCPVIMITALDDMESTIRSLQWGAYEFLTKPLDTTKLDITLRRALEAQATRQREADDFEYRKALERKKAQDKYDEDVRLQEKKNRERQEALEKSWQEREAKLKEQEEELARLRKDSEAFPKRLQQEIERAAAEANRHADERHKQQLLIAEKDGAADKRVAELQVKTLEEIVGRQAAQIAAMQKQLDEAKQQVQDIAVKAIEGASNARALSHVNQIAMEQAKQRGERDR